VTVCVPVQKQITVNVTTYQKVQKTRQVNYLECVPVKRQGQRMVTEYTTVTEPRQENYVEMTQRTVEKDVLVRVGELVAKKVQVPVCAPVVASCGGCDSGCNDCCDSHGRHGLFGGRKCR
jgi:hypothetical protein